MTAIALPQSPRHAVRALALAAVLAGVAGTAVSLVADDRAPAPATDVAPETVLAREPYMRVACPRASATRCDRVGLAVWLKRPAREVSAMIAGRPLRLASPAGIGPSGDGVMYTGYLEPAGIRSRLHVTPSSGERYWGIEPPSPGVMLRITELDGSVDRTRLQVWLMAGQG
jgi:hypothetical protein